MLDTATFGKYSQRSVAAQHEGNECSPRDMRRSHASLRVSFFNRNAFVTELDFDHPYKPPSTLEGYSINSVAGEFDPHRTIHLTNLIVDMLQTPCKQIWADSLTLTLSTRWASLQLVGMRSSEDERLIVIRNLQRKMKAFMMLSGLAEWRLRAQLNNYHQP